MMPQVNTETFTRTKSPQVVINRSRKPPQPPPDQLDPDLPRSYHEWWKHSLSIRPEAEAIHDLKEAWKAQPHELLIYEGYKTRKQYLECDLEDFEIYTSPECKKGSTLISLECLDLGGRVLWFNGVLSIGPIRRYVQGVPIKVYSIEGYGDDEDPVAVVYIQSQEASRDPKHDLWYKLTKPARHYERFHNVFQWVVIFAKHVIDFLETRREGIIIGLEAFRQDFHLWLLQRFRGNNKLRCWLDAFGGTDFRQAINAHINFLSQEAYNLPNANVLLKHSLWADCLRDDHQSIITQPMVCDKTVAAPHTYACFKNRYFAERLIEIQPTTAVQQAQERRKRLLGLPVGLPWATSRKGTYSRQSKSSSFEAGDVVAILPDDEENELWHNQITGRTLEWYAYVQKVEAMQSGEQRLFVIWLYRPEDTTISTTDYPVTKELFLSDHCNCKARHLLSSDVARLCEVEWFSTSYDTLKEYLVRQKYVTEDSSFVSLKQADFECDCNRVSNIELDKRRQGDAIYAMKNVAGRTILEPVVIHCIDHNKKEIIAHRLLRLGRDCKDTPGNTRRGDVAANELVWTNELIRIPIKRLEVKRKCHIRHFVKDEILSRKVPFPYNRGGAGDFWILSSQLIMLHDVPTVEYITESPSMLNAGPDLMADAPLDKLRGLSLFSGFGNLDRGLEEGGAVEFETFIDMCPAAIHSIHANSPHPEELKLWLGSVDDYLKALLNGDSIPLIARIGDVAVIAAGSPCPGFSTLQQNPFSQKSLKNASHVTTFCSFVEMLSPKHAFLENVVNMASTRRGHEEELVLSQVIACLVSLGYQVQQFIMSSWNYGSPQQRSRLILSIAAPGLVPISPPLHTHSHPNDARSRSVGKLLNGERFGMQEDYPTPFPFVTADKATAHLPSIGSGSVYSCIRYPDHRLMRLLNGLCLDTIKCVPTNPQGQCLADAYRLGLVPPHVHREKKELLNRFRRIKGDGLIQTILTAQSPDDARSGGCIHWSEHRTISIEEAKEAQGIPSGEVIIGSAAQQMRLIGNAVDRHCSILLGLSLRRAYNQSLKTSRGGRPRGARQPVCVMTPVAAPPSSYEQSLMFSGSSSTLNLESDISRSSTPQLTSSLDSTDSSSIDAQGSNEWNSSEEIYVDKSEDSFKLPLGPASPNGLLRRFSLTLGQGINSLRSSLPALPNLPSPTKRTHEEQNHRKQAQESDDELVSSKRARRSDYEDWTVASLGSRDGEPDILTPRRTSRSDETSSSSRTPITQKLRRSGAQVEFVPQVWNKTVEREVKKERERARGGSRPFA